jgi:hypothetical protein
VCNEACYCKNFAKLLHADAHVNSKQKFLYGSSSSRGRWGVVVKACDPDLGGLAILSSVEEVDNLVSYIVLELGHGGLNLVK